MDKPSDFMIIECGNHYVLTNKKGKVENHTHLKKRDTCHLLIKLVCRKEVPRSPYLRTSAKRISRNKKYIREIEIKEEKDKQKQYYFNPQKGGKKMTDYKGKYAFISHPYKDNPEENKKSVDRICKYLAGQGIIPISPLHLFSFYENDCNREEIMNICYELIKISDVVFVFGDSEGCRMERKFAYEIDKPIEVFFNEDY